MIKHLKYGFFVFLFLTLSNELFCQKKQRYPKRNKNCASCKLKEKLVFGGGIGGGFGKNSTSINISPNIGVRINDKLIMGLGGTYSYSKYDNRYDDNLNYTYKIWGGNTFLHYEVLNRIFTNARFEQFNWTSNQTNNDTWESSLYLGLGYGQKIGKGMMQIGFEYDVLYDKNTSPYSSALRFPIVTVLF